MCVPACVRVYPCLSASGVCVCLGERWIRLDKGERGLSVSSRLREVRPLHPIMWPVSQCRVRPQQRWKDVFTRWGLSLMWVGFLALVHDDISWKTAEFVFTKPIRSYSCKPSYKRVILREPQNQILIISMLPPQPREYQRNQRMFRLNKAQNPSVLGTEGEWRGCEGHWSENRRTATTPHGGREATIPDQKLRPDQKPSGDIHRVLNAKADKPPTI